ncbi:hypothetical protein BOX15_Mlig032827g1 [Macrostomum lignano]|uniref:WAPL domain-containing protein n=1 Tax=Macrostomum lignano TaxID=282301 RepID=A0A267F9T4_9PLAT|nr:hypothetical protein BOX15_Mlig032827g1 [Macrostomum lignano]
MSAFDFDGGSHGSPPDVVCKAAPIVKQNSLAQAQGVASSSTSASSASIGRRVGKQPASALSASNSRTAAQTSQPKQAKLEETSRVSKFFQKKGSTGSMKQRYLASYNHRPWNTATSAGSSSSSEFVAPQPPPPPSRQPRPDSDDGLFVAPVAPPPPLFRRTQTAPSSTILAASSSSASATSTAASVRVRHVKAAAEVAEQGEQQSFADDVRYLMDGLRPGEPQATRLLSLMQCVEQCVSCQEFRLHLKAHRLHPSLFRLLGATEDDAPQPGCDPQLSLGTAALFYALSRDRATLLLDKAGLGLLLRLLDTPDIRPQQADRLRQRLRNLFPDVPPELLTSARRLAMAALLSLGIRRASPWFKEAIRLQRGLDHALEALRDDLDYFGDDLGPQELNESMLARLARAREFLSLLENMSYKCPDNQQHLVAPCQPLLLRLMRLCSANRTAAPTAAACLLSGLQLLINLSHDNARAAELLSTGSGGADLLETIANLALDCGEDDGAEAPASTSASASTGTAAAPADNTKFDLTLLSLGVLINLAEHSDENQRRVSRLPGLIDRLAELFNVRFLRACSHELEEHLPDGSGAGGGSGSGGPDGRTERNGDEDETSSRSVGGDLEFGGHPSPSPFDRRVGAGGAAASRRMQQGGDAFHSALSRAGEHMEDSVVAAYAGLLLCCLAQRDIRLAALIRTRLKPQPSFVPVLSCVTKFLSFLTLAASAGNQEERQKSHEEAESIARLLKAVSRVEDAIREEDRLAASSEATDAWSAASTSGGRRGGRGK